MNDSKMNVAMPVLYKNSKEGEKSSNSRLYKLRKWWNSRALPWIKKVAQKADKAVRSIPIGLSKIHFNWVSLLALIILVNMANNGMLDEMPNLKWLVETSIYLMEWLAGVLRILVEMLITWVTNTFAI